jgi:protein-glutamine gamma-glutamyltransferase
MNTPPFLLGATLLFWGWQTDLLPFAIVMAVVLEGSRLVKARWDFTQTDLDHIWNLCTLLFLGAALYALTSTEGAKAWVGLAKQNNSGARADALNKSARSVLLFFQWMPFTFFPIAAAQAFSQREKLDLSTFSWWLRRRRKERSARATDGLNVGFPYFAVCVLAASAAKARSPWFFAGLCLLVGWALWRGRPRSSSPAAWAGSLMAALVLGFFLQVGLVYVQAGLQRLENALVNRFTHGRDVDAKESRTRLGAIGPLKLSGSIVLRVKSGDQPPPPLLREASYNFFKSPYWVAVTRDFGAVFFETTNESTWVLQPEPAAPRSVTIASFLDGGKGVLALPHGAAVLDQLPVFRIETNRLGVVRSVDGPGFVEFVTRYGNLASIDAPPTTNDLQIPATELGTLEHVATDLRLAGRPTNEIVSTVGRWFADRFEYSTWVGTEARGTTSETALARFLLRHRKGHCEYFATATALLLRQAGIPARYAVGYAVQEHKGREWIVRERHAHAWCLAWVDGAWRDVDTTPGSWMQVEGARASFWESVSDLWSKAWFAFSKFRWGQTEVRKYVVWLIVPPLVIVAARLAFSKQWRRVRERAREAAAKRNLPGQDSEFYLVEKRLVELGLERRDEETPAAWIARLRGIDAAAVATLEPALTLHYRLRFDPAGISAGDRASLRDGALAWLRRSHEEQRSADHRHDVDARSPRRS